jgi:hypothetical protein
MILGAIVGSNIAKNNAQTHQAHSAQQQAAAAQAAEYERERRERADEKHREEMAAIQRQIDELNKPKEAVFDQFYEGGSQGTQAVYPVMTSHAQMAPSFVPEGLHCGACGSLVPAGQKFCGNCGTPAQQPAGPWMCPNQHTNQPAMRFCTMCGSPKQ